MIIWNRLKYVLSPQFDIYKVVSPIISGKVVDIGFGTGFGTHLFAQHSDVVGYEVDEEAVEFAKSVFPHIDFRCGDVVKGIDGKFDFVVMVDVLEHIRQDKKALLNAKDMLLSGGKLILSTPNRLSRYRKSKNHVKEYAPRELEGILERYSLS